MKKRLFYVWFLPLLWIAFSIMSFFYSGDEHGCFAIGATAGTWIRFLYQFDTLGQALFPVLITGGIILGLTGIIMDWLGVKKKLWLSLFVLFLVVFFVLAVSQFESYEHIRSKHRSILAIVFCVCNLSIYAAIIFSLIINALKGLWKLIKTKPASPRMS